jgi:hypothetical protein
MAGALEFRSKERVFYFTIMPYLMSSLRLAPAVYPHCYTCTERKCGEARGFTAQYLVNVTPALADRCKCCEQFVNPSLHIEDCFIFGYLMGDTIAILLKIL